MQEACLPLIAPYSTVSVEGEGDTPSIIGIIDSESFTEGIFDSGEESELLFAVVMVLNSSLIV